MSFLRSLTNLSMVMIDLKAIALISSESYLQSLALHMKLDLWKMGNMEPRMMPMDNGMEWFVN
uniref:Alternative protein GRIK2 n=1 Tax=Homo sapiens TaxID=9606 RepID=L8E9A1_HUMAN|nr:alternative protein GRIK2 [Homo sapiens]